MEHSQSCGIFAMGNQGFPLSGNWNGCRTRATSCHIFLLVVLVTFNSAFLFSHSVNAASIKMRAFDGTQEVCRTNGICGWAVHHPIKRYLLFYVSSLCTCKEKELCIRCEDDISILAYVYRCREPRKRQQATLTTTKPTI